MVLGVIGPGDEKFIDGAGNVYWFRFPERGGGLGLRSTSPWSAKTVTGERAYTDQDVFSALSMGDFTGGMGQDRAVDTTKYHTGFNVDTRGGRIILGPGLTGSNAAGMPDIEDYLLTLKTSEAVNTGVTFSWRYVCGVFTGEETAAHQLAAKITLAAGHTRLDRVWLMLKGTPQVAAVVVYLQADSGNQPGAVLGTATVNVADLRPAGGWVQATFATAVTGLTAGASYWITLFYAGDSQTTVGWYAAELQVGVYGNAATYDGMTWSDLRANGHQWYLFYWYADPLLYPDSPPMFLLGAGKDLMLRIWAYAGRFLYYLDKSSLATVALAPTTPKDMAVQIVDAAWFSGTGDTHAYLFLALGEDTDMQKFDGNVGTEVWAAVTGKKAIALAVHDDLLWRAYERNHAAGSLTGAWAESGSDALVGDKTYPIRKMVSWNGNLWVGKDDGLYKVSNDAGYPTSDDATATRIIDLTALADPANFACMVVHQGDLYFSVATGILKYTTSGVLTPVGPETGLDLAANQRAYYRGAVSTLNTLFIGSEAPPGGYSGVLAYVDGNWHPIIGLSREGDMVRSVALDPALYANTPRLWFGAGLKIAYAAMPTTTQKRWLWSEMTWDSKGHLITSWLDGNIRTIEKDWIEVVLDVQHVGTGTGPYVQVKWRPDENTAWVQLGANVTVNGLNTVAFPTGSHGAKCQIRIDLAEGLEDGAYQTPHVEAVVVKYLERPKDLRGFTRTYELSTWDINRPGAPVAKSLAQQVADLETLRESKEPLTWYAWWGGVYTVHIIEYSGSEAREKRGDLMDSGTINVTLLLQALV